MNASTESPIVEQQSTPQVDGAQNVFIARQPIFDQNTRCVAYELLFRGGLENVCPPGDPNRAASQTLQSAWLTFGIPTLVGPKKAFTNFTRDLLLSGYAETLPADSVVIELLETVDGDPEVVAACQKLRQKGYTLALDDFVYRPSLDPLIPLADVVKIGFRDSDPTEQVQQLRRFGPDEPVLLAEMVETREDHGRATDLGFTRFQGYFFSKPEIVTGRTLSGARLTYIKLLQAVTRPEMSVDEVDAVIRADVAVTHRLLKYLGSPALGFRAEIQSVRHGLALFGKEQTRKFVSLVALGELGSEKPHELLVSAAVRARFCELIGPWLADRKPELFLVWALSLVDAMLDQPMSRVLAELPLSDDVRLALLGQRSPLRPVLEFVERYERGDWEACAELGGAHGIAEANILEHYNEAVSWATQALTG